MLPIRIIYLQMGKKFEFNITGKFRIKNKSFKTIIQRVVQKCTKNYFET